ncbi:DUF4148 domain-containing protein [Paraburkholderia sacchari]|uniref:DUF4148 domain-containing protein n=1 Tax=Paraburkholderia sacchari TaxID=159450 RepID=UPI0005433FBB|nr:DUF4148 domain-containing protein [Paraburkholderia sacchari]NLP59876.1 DUF4148 domain-containing protein [Paraburkholderia sacchari]
MKRTLATALGASLVITLAASASAFADADAPQAAQIAPVVQADNKAPKTRAEVKAELAEAYRSGTLPALNKTSYPDQGLIGRTQAQRIALQESRANWATHMARAGE